MSIVFKELRLKNFLSFGNVEQVINLTSKDFTLITGINKDKSADDTGNRNGIGKSSFFNALHYALYGKAIGNKINLPNLVNNINKKNMTVTLLFEKNGIQYRIERGRNPTFLRFYKEDNEITDESLGDSRDTQSIIEDIIGMSDDLFCQTILLSCNVPIFLDQNTSTQKLIIEKVLGIDILTKKINALKEVIKENKNNINNETFRINTLKSSMETQKNNYLSQIEDLKRKSEQWYATKEQTITQLNNQITDLSNIDFRKEKELIKVYKDYRNAIEKWQLDSREAKTLQDKIYANQVEYSNVQKQVETLDAINVEEELAVFSKNQEIKQEMDSYNKLMIEKQQVKNRYNELNFGFQSLSQEMNMRREQVSKYEQNICPTCGQVMNKEEAEKEIARLNMEIRQFSDAIHKVDMEMMNIVNTLSSFPEDGKRFDLLPTKYASVDEVYKIVSNKDALVTKLHSINDMNKILETQLSAYNLETPKEPTEVSHYISEEDIYKDEALLETLKKELETKMMENDPYNGSIKEWQDMISKLEDVNEDELKVMIYEQNHNEMLLKLLNSPSSFIRQSILDKSLAYLNSRIKYYSNKLGSLHIVQFNNDMSIDISYMGIKYGYVSSGEMGRISLALTFAFRDAWESLSGIKINLLMIDEILDRSGLDTNGISMVVDCLKENTDKNTFLVSHNDILNQSIPNKITIVKERSFSNIVI
jgi:DNA repair exonuclease SbcCD ATPase subunit